MYLTIILKKIETMNNTETVKTYTLHSLLEKYDTIEIPVLQRAYAQGRTTNEVIKVRQDFVDYLAKHLATKEAVALDFVYGAIKEDNNKKIFIPLDGQQRLTTLWLLHWFLAAKEGGDTIKAIKDLLKKFVYETRPAAESFCNYLLKESIPTEEIKNLKNYLSDREWFDETWHNDATVEGMLIMLDTFSQNEQLLSPKVTLDLLWDKEIISFYFLSIDKFGLTDELYIRMNARGEKLTDFEHFKSEFYKTIQEYSGIEEIKNKMEKEWVESLWKYREKGLYVTDTPFLNYLSFINKMQFHKNLKEKDKDEYGYPKKESVPDDFLRLNYIVDTYKNDENVAFLEFALDSISFLKDISYEKLLAGKSFESIFTEMMQGKAETDESIIIYATLLYLEKHRGIKIDDRYLLEFIRVIRNLIVNTDDKGTRIWNRILPSIERIAQQQDIYQVLLNETETTLVGFRNTPVKEEIFKAKLFAEKPDAKEILHPIEDHEVLLGDLTNLIATTYGYDDVVLFDIGQQEPTALSLSKLENIYKAYDEIYQEDNKFVNIWGDLLITSIYKENEWRVYWEQTEYKKHRAIFCLALLYAQSGKTTLQNFLISYEKEEVLTIYNANAQNLSQVKSRKEQLFLLYVITRRVMGKEISDFFKRNGYNFGWLDKNGNYQPIFDYPQNTNPAIFQVYRWQFRYNEGIKDEATLPPELAASSKRTTFLGDLLIWAKK